MVGKTNICRFDVVHQFKIGGIDVFICVEVGLPDMSCFRGERADDVALA